LCQLYSEGKELDLIQYVNSGTLKKVKDAYEQLNKEGALKPIFEKLHENVSYGEIRISLAIIQRNE